MTYVKSCVDILSASFQGSVDSVVDKRRRNNLYDVKSWVDIFSASFGSVDSAVD